MSSTDPKKTIDFPLVVMGLSIIAMALSEYFLTGIAGEDRMAVKILNGLQTLFALLFGMSGIIGAPATTGGTGKRVVVAFFLLFFYLCVAGVASSTNYLNTIYLRIMFLYWFALFLFFYARSCLYPDRIQWFLILTVCSLLIWIPALLHFSKVRTTVSYDGMLRQNYVGYYIVAIFPFALMLKRNSLKIAAFALITFGAVYSLKRGAVLALGMMGVVSSFLYVIFLAEGTQKIKNIIILICLWGVSGTGGALFVMKNQHLVEKRIESDTGRSEIYASTWSAAKQSDMFALIIGHGDNGAQIDTGHAPHSDWLLLLYDYGIISVVLMLNVYFWLGMLLLKMIRLKSKLMLPLSSSILMMFIVQCISMGLILKLFGLITGCIGLVVGSFQVEYEPVMNVNPFSRFQHIKIQNRFHLNSGEAGSYRRKVSGLPFSKRRREYLKK